MKSSDITKNVYSFKSDKIEKPQVSVENKEVSYGFIQDTVDNIPPEPPTVTSYNNSGEISNINKLYDKYKSDIFISVKSMSSILENNEELFKQIILKTIESTEGWENKETYNDKRYEIQAFIHKQYPNLFSYSAGICLMETLEDLQEELFFISSNANNILNVKGKVFCEQIRNEIITEMKEKFNI